MAERSFAEEVKKLRLGAGESFDGEGILAVTKALLQSGVGLCRRLPGLADLAPDGRAGRCAGHPGRDGRALRDQRQRGDRRGHAGGVGQLPAARRGDLQVHGGHQRGVGRAGQSGVGRRHRRRAGHRRRGLRRWLQHHAGAQPRLRDEVADVAARPAAEPAVDRQGCRRRLRAVRGQPHAGDAAAAHPRLPRARPLRRQGQPQAALLAGRGRQCAEARYAAHRAAAGQLRARAGKGAAALAGRGALHRRARSERVLRGRQRRCRRDRAGRPLQLDAARDGTPRPGRCLWPAARAAVRDERRLPADRQRAEALLCRQARGAAGRGRPAELHRAGHCQRAAPGRAGHAADRQGRAAGRRRVHADAPGRGPAQTSSPRTHRNCCRRRRLASSRSAGSTTRCTHARRGFAPAAPSGRCSPR